MCTSSCSPVRAAADGPLPVEHLQEGKVPKCCPASGGGPRMHENKTENMPIKYIKISPLGEIRIFVMQFCLCLSSLSLSSLCSYAAVCDFLVNNNLLSVIRAHEAQDAG